MIPLPPPPNRSPAQSGGLTHRRGGAEQRTAAALGPGCPQCLFPLALPSPPKQQSKRNPTLTQKPSTSLLWDQDCLLASPSSFRDLGKGGTLLRAEPSLGSRPALRMNQALPSLQPLAHSSSSLEGPRMEEKTKQALGYSRAKNARNFLGNAVPYGIH